MKLLFLGFGTVGQGLAELLLEKQQLLMDKHGLQCSVVGISDMLKGSVYNENGIDLKAALDKAKSGDKLDEIGDAFEGDALAMVKAAKADMMIEMTYTDIKTAEPATHVLRKQCRNQKKITSHSKCNCAVRSLRASTVSDNYSKTFVTSLALLEKV